MDVRLDQLEPETDRDVCEVLTALHASGRADTLRDALEQNCLATWVHETCTLAEQWSVMAQLRRWLGWLSPGSTGPDDLARLAFVQDPPASTAELIAWAREHGIENELQRQVCEVLPETSLAGLTVIDAATSSAQGPWQQGPSRSERYFEQHLRAHLRASACVRHGPAARTELWQRSNPWSALHSLFHRLRERVTAYPRAELDEIRFLPHQRVVLEADSGVCKAIVRAERVLQVSLQLDGHEHNAVQGTCEACDVAHCVHQAALAARLMDASLDTSDRLHSSLVQFVHVPSWQRFFRKLEQAAASDTDPVQLRFEVEVIGGQVLVGVLYATDPGSTLKLSAAVRYFGASACLRTERSSKPRHDAPGREVPSS